MRRYAVVAALFALSVITYVDRACISAAKDDMASGLSLSDSAMGLVFGAFSLGYALAQIPAGWFADRHGPRIALAAVVIGWSAFTALTGAAWSLWSLIAIRFLFGVGEAGAFPGSTRAFYNWLPASERGRANGFLFSGSRLGAALAFPLLVWMMSQITWRWAFAILGSVGVVWALFWLAWFRDYPEGGPHSARQDATSALSLRDVFRTPVFIPAMAQYFAGNFTFFLSLTWMLPYLKRQYSLPDGTAAQYAMLPLLMGATSQWITGFLVDRLYRSPMAAWSRRLPAIIGFAIAAAGVGAAGWVPSAGLAVICLTVATFGADMTISPSWSYCADIAGKNSGSVSAAMNMVGNLGAFISANAFPLLLSWTGTARSYFVVAGVLNLIAVACWVCMRSHGLTATQTGVRI